MTERNFKFALVRTFDSGNIGSSLRAIKNMCDGELWVIDPINYKEEEIRKFAAGAREHSNSIVRDRSLRDFAAGCNRIYALSARQRRDIPSMSLEKMSREIDKSSDMTVGFIFGNETNGLNDAELHYASSTVHIPTPGPHASLNLSQAVLLTAWQAAGISPISATQAGISVEKKEILFDSIYELITTVFFQKEITEARTKRLIYNAVKKWPLTQPEFKYLYNTFNGMVEKIRRSKRD